MAPRYSYKIDNNKQGCQGIHTLDLFSSIYYWENKKNFLDNYLLQETLLFIDSTDNRLFLQGIALAHASFALFLVMIKHNLMKF
jgi:hypothetical protein